MGKKILNSLFFLVVIVTTYSTCVLSCTKIKTYEQLDADTCTVIVRKLTYDTVIVVLNQKKITIPTTNTKDSVKVLITNRKTGQLIIKVMRTQSVRQLDTTIFKVQLLQWDKQQQK